jgi:hypothetical protein
MTGHRHREGDRVHIAEVSPDEGAPRPWLRCGFCRRFGHHQPGADGTFRYLQDQRSTVLYGVGNTFGRFAGEHHWNPQAGTARSQTGNVQKMVILPVVPILQQPGNAALEFAGGQLLFAGKHPGVQMQLQGEVLLGTELRRTMFFLRARVDELQDGNLRFGKPLPIAGQYQTPEHGNTVAGFGNDLEASNFFLRDGVLHAFWNVEVFSLWFFFAFFLLWYFLVNVKKTAERRLKYLA